MNTFFYHCGGTDWFAETTYDFTKARLGVQHVSISLYIVSRWHTHNLIPPSQLSEALYRFFDGRLHARRVRWQHYFFYSIIANSCQGNRSDPPRLPCQHLSRSVRVRRKCSHSQNCARSPGVREESLAPSSSQWRCSPT